MKYVNLIHVFACDVVFYFVCDRTCRNWREHIRPNLHLDIVRSGIHCDALITFFFKIEYEGIVKIVIKPKLTEFALFVVKFVLLNLHFSV
jgi:hypothetical protein